MSLYDIQKRAPRGALFDVVCNGLFVRAARRSVVTNTPVCAADFTLIHLLANERRDVEFVVGGFDGLVVAAVGV